jgi:hypothetical protein
MTDLPAPALEPDGRHTGCIHVAIYEHRYGNDVRAFRDEGDAWKWRTRIAQEWWSNEFDDTPPPYDTIGADYFDRMSERDEYFSVVPCEIESGASDPDGEGSAS